MKRPDSVKTTATETHAQPIRFVRKQEIMHRTGLSSSTIYDLMKRNLFPQSIKLAGGKAVAWLESDLETWLNDCLSANEKGAE